MFSLLLFIALLFGCDASPAFSLLVELTTAACSLIATLGILEDWCIVFAFTLTVLMLIFELLVVNCLKTCVSDELLGIVTTCCCWWIPWFVDCIDRIGGFVVTVLLFGWFVNDIDDGVVTIDARDIGIGEFKPELFIVVTFWFDVPPWFILDGCCWITCWNIVVDFCADDPGWTTCIVGLLIKTLRIGCCDWFWLLSVTADADTIVGWFDVVLNWICLYCCCWAWGFVVIISEKK